MPIEKKNTAAPWQSVVAGAAAGGVESLLTYPTEYIKTRKQLHSSPESLLNILLSTVRSSGVGGLYAGAGAFVLSNASKSGVRFFAFDMVKTWLPKDPRTSRPTKVASMLAGVTAGVAESITVVTPGENIKTRIIESRAGGNRLTSTSEVIRVIWATNGVKGFYRGLLPVSMKQGSNALVRFTTYNALLGVVEPVMASTKLGGATPAVAGALAGVVTVYATMPFDVVKTKMQGATRGSRSHGTVGCFVETVREGGVRDLWKGTTPRLARLSISGAVSFTIYEKVTELLQMSRGGLGRSEFPGLAKGGTAG